MMTVEIPLLQINRMSSNISKSAADTALKYPVPICPASILYKSIAGRYRPVRVADGPITARYRFM